MDDKYTVWYIGHGDNILAFADFNLLNKAIADAIYWLNNESTKMKISEIEIRDNSTYDVICRFPGKEC